jgi:hypothetical protein
LRAPCGPPALSRSSAAGRATWPACARLSRRERFAAAVVAQVSLPLDYVRLNISAIKS